MPIGAHPAGGGVDVLMDTLLFFFCAVFKKNSFPISTRRDVPLTANIARKQKENKHSQYVSIIHTSTIPSFLFDLPRSYEPVVNRERERKKNTRRVQKRNERPFCKKAFFISIQIFVCFLPHFRSTHARMTRRAGISCATNIPTTASNTHFWALKGGQYGAL